MHKNKMKPKSSSRLQSSEPPEPAMSMSEEDKESFEAELCWCIKQLQTGLRLGKLSQKQVQDHVKALNVLTSKTAPLIKKRQVMRLSFGDYRSKMAEDDKRFNKVNQQVKVTTKKPNSNSAFIKKSVNSSQNEFSFDFQIPTDIQEECKDNCPSVVDFHFKEATDTFKFNFDV
ncbi:hypothetical protein FQA39_LY11489 [Lamprigera yunnana]|nr:hypothetical protein FQA39_LY11489 [Lamprigera yunnana]